MAKYNTQQLMDNCCKGHYKKSKIRTERTDFKATTNENKLRNEGNNSRKWRVQNGKFCFVSIRFVQKREIA